MDGNIPPLFESPANRFTNCSSINTLPAGGQLALAKSFLAVFENIRTELAGPRLR